MVSMGCFVIKLYLQHLMKYRSQEIGNTMMPGSASDHLFKYYRPSQKRHEHSTITCQLDETGSDFDRRCHLENVCWDRTASTFVYFLDPDRPDMIMPGATMLDGTARKISVKTKPGPFRLARSIEFLPLVERAGPIPLTNATFTEDKVYVYFTSFWAENFGHALVDDIHPLFALMHAFKMTTRDSVFLYPRKIADNVGERDRVRASKVLNELANLISDNGILRMDTHPSFSTVSLKDSGPHLVCMRHLLAGSGNLENLNQPPHVNTVGSWPSFIDAILTGWRQEMGIHTLKEEDFSSLIETQLLVFVKKVGRRRLINLDMIVEKSRSKFAVETLVINPGEMTLIEQISVAQRATVTFSPCGGISFFNAFLRDGATAIVADYWDVDENASLMMDGHFWDRIVSGHQTLRYSVRESDIVIEVPGNATANRWTDFKDYGATMLDLEQAMRLIDRGLYMAQHAFNIEKRHI
jgi:hypothetical protein